MAAQSPEWTPQARYAADYAAAFDEFVRSMRRQGFPLGDRILEGAAEKAEKRAREQAVARGHRTLPFPALAKDGLAQGRHRWGY